MKYFLLAFVILPIYLYCVPSHPQIYAIDKNNDPAFHGFEDLCIGNLIHENEEEVHVIIYNKKNCIWIVKKIVK